MWKKFDEIWLTFWMLSGAKTCKYCRSRQELSNEYLVFTCKIRLRYSRERASRRLPKISQTLKKSWVHCASCSQRLLVRGFANLWKEHRVLGCHSLFPRKAVICSTRRTRICICTGRFGMGIGVRLKRGLASLAATMSTFAQRFNELMSLCTARSQLWSI